MREARPRSAFSSWTTLYFHLLLDILPAFTAVKWHVPPLTLAFSCFSYRGREEARFRCSQMASSLINTGFVVFLVQRTRRSARRRRSACASWTRLRPSSASARRRSSGAHRRRGSACSRRSATGPPSSCRPASVERRQVRSLAIGDC